MILYNFLHHIVSMPTHTLDQNTICMKLRRSQTKGEPKMVLYGSATKGHALDTRDNWDSETRAAQS